MSGSAVIPVTEASLHMAAGMEPVSMFSCKRRTCKLDKSARLSGTVPVSLFSYKRMPFRTARLPRVSGMVPVNRLPFKRNHSRAERDAISVGRDPVKPLDHNHNSNTSPLPLQTTPPHSHISSVENQGVPALLLPVKQGLRSPRKQSSQLSPPVVM